MSEPAKCTHIKLDGHQCGGNALRRQAYCYYHKRYHDTSELPTGHTAYNVPVFEDSRSILLAIHQALRSCLSGTLDPKACTLALYGYQVAASVIQRKDARSPLEQQQLEAKSEARADKGTANSDGDFPLAPLLVDTLEKYDWSKRKP